MQKIKAIIKEIAAVGLADWLWFVIILRRNEFHRRLRLERYYKKKSDREATMARRAKDLLRAHAIDLKLMTLRASAPPVGQVSPCREIIEPLAATRECSPNCP